MTLETLPLLYYMSYPTFNSEVRVVYHSRPRKRRSNVRATGFSFHTHTHTPTCPSPPLFLLANRAVKRGNFFFFLWLRRRKRKRRRQQAFSFTVLDTNYYM